MRYLVAFALVTTWTLSAEATTIDFDGFADGTPITTQYQPQGVHFNGGAGPATIFRDLPEATSLPNILVGDNNFDDLFLRFVDPTTGLARVADNVSVNVISVGSACRK